LDLHSSLGKLVLSASYLTNPDLIFINSGTFYALSNLIELQLRGFENIRYVDKATLEPLRNLRCLYLESYGLISAELRPLTNLLRGLWGTPLESIAMNGIVGALNPDTTPVWNFTDIFAIKNVTVKSLTIDNTAITSITGLISDVLPDLTLLSISLQAPYQDFIYTLLDSFFLLKSLTEMRFYGYPNQISMNFDRNIIYSDNAPVVFSSIYATNKSCLIDQMLVFPSNVTTLAINNFTFGAFSYLVFENYANLYPRPLCFDEQFRCEHLDMSDSTLPKSLVLIVGLVHLKTCNLQHTGIRKISNQ